MAIQAYKVKAIISGPVVEFYRYEDTVFRGYKSTRTRSASQPEITPCIDYETGEIIEDEKRLESRARSNIRARNELRRIVLCNFNNRSKFITLTFKEPLKDVSAANKYFGNFIRKLQRKYDDFKYVAVIEFHESGDIHYHMLCNLNYVGVDKLAKMWGHGGVNIKRIDHVDNVGAYMIKHMTKDDATIQMSGKKSYQCSQNLSRSKELIGTQAEYLYKKMQEEQRKMVYSSQYENKQTKNEIIYEEYNLGRK